MKKGNLVEKLTAGMRKGINVGLAGSMLGIASLTSCSPTEPQIHPCDTVCTLSLESFDNKKLPTPIYTENVMADTIWIDGETFHRQYTLLVTWPDTPVRVRVHQWYDGKVIRKNGNEIDLLWEYERTANGIPLLDTNTIHGVLNKNSMLARQDSLYTADSRVLLYDDRGLFEYAVLPFNTPKPDHTKCEGFCW